MLRNTDGDAESSAAGADQSLHCSIFLEIGSPVPEKNIFEGFYHMSCVMRKTTLCFPTRSDTKPGCSASEDG